MRAVAKEMGKDVEFRNIAFDGLIPSLQSKEVDMSASGMTATKERAEKSFSPLPSMKPSWLWLPKRTVTSTP